eukprot:3574181-Rhodomonas_salina.1
MHASCSLHIPSVKHVGERLGFHQSAPVGVCRDWADDVKCRNPERQQAPCYKASATLNHVACCPLLSIGGHQGCLRAIVASESG